MPLQPVQAVVEKALAVAQFGLAALAIGNPIHALRAQQQVQVVMPRQQRLFQPGRAVAEQGVAPEHVAEQVSVENQ